MGYSPVDPDTGDTGFKDGDKDYDGDNLSNTYELYSSNGRTSAKNAFSLSAVTKDAEYLFVAPANDPDRDAKLEVVLGTYEGSMHMMLQIVDPVDGVNYNLYVQTVAQGPHHLYYENAPENTVIPVPINLAPMMIFQAAANGDIDRDSIVDGLEIMIGTNPTLADSDGDGFPDPWELSAGYNPKVANDVHDLDEDGLSDEEEAVLGTLSTNRDSDGDGITDAEEDADGDLLTNGSEFNKYRTDPKNVQSQLAGKGDAEFKILAFESETSSSIPLRISVDRQSIPWKITVIGTTPGATYQLLSRETPSAHWKVEVMSFTGGLDGRITVVNVLPGARTSLTFVAGIGADSDEDGLSDAYEVLVTRTPPDRPSDSEAHADADMDGWSNLEEYRLGTSPTQVDSPPSPSGIHVSFNSQTRIATVTWDPVPGNVVEYKVWRNSPPQTFTVAAGGPLQIVDDLSAYPSDAIVYYEVSAVLSSTQVSASASSVPVGDAQAWPSPMIIYGKNGNVHLVMQKPAAVLKEIRLFRQQNPMILPDQPFNPITYEVSTGIWRYSPDRSEVNGPASESSFVVDLSNVTGPIQLPTTEFPAFRSYTVWGELVYQNGNKSARYPIPSSARTFSYPFEDGVYPFLDASAHMLENVKFKLRAAPMSSPFSYYVKAWETADTWFTANGAPGYVYSGFSTDRHYRLEFPGLAADRDYAKPEEERIDPFLPFQENRLFENWRYNSSYFSVVSGPLGPELVYDTGIWNFSGDFGINPPPRFNFNSAAFVQNTPTGQIPLTTFSDSDLIFRGDGFNDENSEFAEWDMPITFLEESAIFEPNTRNYYGLFFSRIGWVTSPTDIRSASPGSFDPPEEGIGDMFFQNTVAPSLMLTDHYFARGASYDYPIGDVRPGREGFTPGTASPLIIVPFGRPVSLQAWAKFSLQNGDPANPTFAFTQQYFDNAYEAYPDSAGAISSIETGIISEYGDFFATKPGKIWLKTKPELSTGQVATHPIYVIKLQLDVNHDGQMNTTYSGPDNTSSAAPFTFWVNDDSDLYTFSKYAFATGAGADSFAERDEVDAGKNLQNRTKIETSRDLEDFARLWIEGMPVLDASYEVTLQWNAFKGSPEINLFRAILETDEYLKDPGVAAAMVLSSEARFLGTVEIGAGTEYEFPPGYFSEPGRRCLLFEGVKAGEGELVLTIRRNSKVLAETSAFIKLENINSMIEQAKARDGTVPTHVPLSGEGAHTGLSSLQSLHRIRVNPADDKQLIVFVHGINNSQHSWKSTTETMYKRLYWAGYRGHIATFRWPCAYLVPDTFNPFLFNLGEYYAWKSGNAFKDFLVDLKNSPRFADYKITIFAHSQGNIVASEAVKLGAPFDNYIITQGAVPAHCYNPATLFDDADLMVADTIRPTPDLSADGGYRGYFGALTAGNIVNFYNPVDFALQEGRTFGKDTNYKANQLSYKPESFGGGLLRYSYNPTLKESKAEYFRVDGSLLSARIVTDFHETKALVARARSKAVGAQAGLVGGGVIDNQVNLFNEFNFGDTRSEHSAQFDRAIQTSLSYYTLLMRTIGIVPNE